MVEPNDLDTGMAIYVDDDLHIVMDYSHSKQARGGAFVRAKLRNVKTGEIKDLRMRPDDDYKQAILEEKPGQFLYDSGQFLVFMDMESYDQIELSSESVGDKEKYLTEGMELEIEYCDQEPIGINLSKHVVLEVTKTDPGLKGDTAQGGTKPATMETGLVVSVPLFINEGEKIKVNSDTGEYVGRAENE